MMPPDPPWIGVGFERAFRAACLNASVECLTDPLRAPPLTPVTVRPRSTTVSATTRPSFIVFGLPIQTDYEIVFSPS